MRVKKVLKNPIPIEYGDYPDVAWEWFVCVFDGKREYEIRVEALHMFGNEFFINRYYTDYGGLNEEEYEKLRKEIEKLTYEDFIPQKFSEAGKPELIMRFEKDDNLLLVYKLDFCGNVIYLKTIKRDAEQKRGDTIIHFSCDGCDKAFVIRVDEDLRVFWHADVFLNKGRFTIEFLTEEEVLDVLQESFKQLKQMFYIHPSWKQILKNSQEVV